MWDDNHYHSGILCFFSPFPRTVGHGRSEGERVHVEDVDSYVQDVIRHVEHMKGEYPNLPCILLGHSMASCSLTPNRAHLNPPPLSLGRSHCSPCEQVVDSQLCLESWNSAIYIYTCSCLLLLNDKSTTRSVFPVPATQLATHAHAPI